MKTYSCRYKDYRVMRCSPNSRMSTLQENTRSHIYVKLEYQYNKYHDHYMISYKLHAENANVTFRLMTVTNILHTILIIIIIITIITQNYCFRALCFIFLLFDKVLIASYIIIDPTKQNKQVHLQHRKVRWKYKLNHEIYQYNTN